jgi:hypothetical protein
MHGQHTIKFTSYSCQYLKKRLLSPQISQKYLNIKFHDNPSSRSPSCATQTDRHDEAFRNFVNVPKNYTVTSVITYTTVIFNRAPSEPADNSTCGPLAEKMAMSKNDPGFESQQGQDSFLFSKAFRPALGPT